VHHSQTDLILKEEGTMAKNGTGKRGGRRKVVDKDDVAETRKAQKNSLIDGNRLLHHVNTIKEYNAKIENLSGHRRKAYDVMKNEGFDPQVIRDTIKLEKEDPLVFRAYFEQMGVALKVTGQMFQLNVFDTAFGNPVAQATAEGRDDAKNGRPPNNRYPEGTEAADAYQKAYHGQQADMVPGADMLSEAEKAKAVAGAASA
jgi:uncharacterized protein (UPF0335 family)